MSRTHRDHSWSKRWWIGVKKAALGRDKKPGAKPPGWWKRMQSRRRRAKERSALRNGRQVPQFKKTDVWDWN